MDIVTPETLDVSRNPVTAKRNRTSTYRAIKPTRMPKRRPNATPAKTPQLSNFPAEARTAGNQATKSKRIQVGQTDKDDEGKKTHMRTVLRIHRRSAYCQIFLKSEISVTLC